MNGGIAADPVRRAVAGRRRTLVTPEGIALSLLVGTRGARIGALLIDLIAIAVLMIGSSILLFYMAGGIVEVEQKLKQDSAAGHAVQFLVVSWIVLMFLLRNAYFLFFELGPRGATPGKFLLGLRVASRDGGALTTEMVVARNLLRDIELFMPMTLIAFASGSEGTAGGMAALAWFLIIILFPLFNRDALRAGDVIAGTWVIEVPKRKLEAAMSLGRSARDLSSIATGATYRFGEAELAIYGEYELQTLERVLREDREEAMVAVHEAICRKIGWAPGSGDERAFLEAYYTQLRARLEGQMRLGRRKADKFA